MNFNSLTVEEKPFKVYIFDGLLQDNEEVEKLRKDLTKSVKIKKKDNDLYRFAQSKDLRCELDSRKLSGRTLKFVESLATDIRQKLEKETSIKLSEKHLDVTVSRYKFGDYLLCHNDHLKYNTISDGHRRALAFVFYLTKRPWEVEKDGGGLALYEADTLGEPIQVIKRIASSPNRLVVFETSQVSWHAVEEVLCTDDIRLSINGWFHTHCSEEIVPKSANVEACPYTLYRPITVTSGVEKFFHDCINQEYLSNQTCALIRRRFKKKSEINLINFLVPEMYKKISESLVELTKEEENLTMVGPYNKRHYSTLKFDKLPPLCRDLYDAFRSELFYMQLSRLTGLDLQPSTLGDVSESEEQESSDSGESDDSSSQNSNSPSPSQSESDTNPTLENEEEENECDKHEETQESNDVEEKKETPPKNRPVKRRKVSDPLARFEFRHFQHGSYSLIHDHSFELAEKSALDVMLHFNHDFEVNFQDGGFISYIDGSGDENTTDQGTCRFVKHINKSHHGDYQDFSCVFYERPDDVPSDAKIYSD